MLNTDQHSVPLRAHASTYQHVIDGRQYLTVLDFARVTNRSTVNVRKLISVGNRIRKLRCVRIVGRPMIPLEEVTEYPFTVAGTSKVIIHYDMHGVPHEQRI